LCPKTTPVSLFQISFIQIELGMAGTEHPKKLQVLLTGLEKRRLKEFFKVLVLFWLEGFEERRELHLTILRTGTKMGLVSQAST
jgi:hypothetical protein